MATRSHYTDQLAALADAAVVAEIARLEAEDLGYWQSEYDRAATFRSTRTFDGTIVWAALYHIGTEDADFEISDLLDW